MQPSETNKGSLQTRLRELLPSRSESLSPLDHKRAISLAGLKFEAFVTELLQAYLKRHENTLETPWIPRELGKYDLISSVSIRDLPPPIAFAIKFLEEPSQRQEQVQNIWRNHLRDKDPRPRTLVLVTNFQPTASMRASLEELRPTAPNLMRLAWWGPEQLEDLIEHLGAAGSEILQTLHVAELGAALRSVSQGTDDLWEASREHFVSELHTSWKEGELVFFLGAGVSIDAGVPPWNHLLSELYRALLEEVSPDLADSSVAGRAQAVELLQSLQDSSPLLSARTLRSGLRGNFEEAVRQALYRRVMAPSSEQLLAIARLCDPPRGRIGARAVVTYNFDDLLEQCLDPLNVDFLSIYSSELRAQSSELAIYHVHGIIPERGKVPTQQTLVFSEEGYHTAYNNPYTWSNVVQLNLMTQHTCIFVGLSMTDPNLRRLLEIASTAQLETGPRHVALLKRATSHGFLQQRIEVNRKMSDAILAIYHSAWEKTMGELGVKIMWFKEFTEIPSLLDGIRTGALDT